MRLIISRIVINGSIDEYYIKHGMILSWARWLRRALRSEQRTRELRTWDHRVMRVGSFQYLVVCRVRTDGSGTDVNKKSDMAALVLLRNSAGKRGVNALVRLKYLNIVDRSVSTCRARLLVGSVSRLGVYGSCSSLSRWDVILTHDIDAHVAIIWPFFICSSSTGVLRFLPAG